MNKDGLRIEKIKSDHAELLKKVRESIITNHENLKGNIEEVVTVLDFDEKSIKKQEATIKAQELVTTLTKEILDAKTKEEIIEIRKRLNYYINKIKSEIKKRELDESYLNAYQEKVTYLRKDIAKYIRFLKREENISEIDHLYSNYDNLNKEEMTDLKKALKREVNYNRRNLAEPKIEDKKLVSESTIDASIKNTLSDSFEVEENTNPYKFTMTQKEDDEDIEFSISESNIQLQRPGNQLKENNNSFETKEYLKSRVKDYDKQYCIRPTLDYSKEDSGKNMISFLKNLPSYIHNKKAIKHMESDNCRFYSGSDLRSYIEYLKRRNSISRGLKCIFSKTHLYSDSNLIKHENCAAWLSDFCEKNGMEIGFAQQLEKTM